MLNRLEFAANDITTALSSIEDSDTQAELRNLMTMTKCLSDPEVVVGMPIAEVARMVDEISDRVYSLISKR